MAACGIVTLPKKIPTMSQKLKQIASKENVDDFQEHVHRNVEEQLAPLEREVNQPDTLLRIESTAGALLEQQMRTRGPSTQKIKLMEPECFKDKPYSNTLQWLDCMEPYMTVGQVVDEKKIQVAWTYLTLLVAPHSQTMANEIEVVGQNNRLWKNKFMPSDDSGLWECYFQTCGPQQIVKYDTKGSMKAHAIEFQLLCAQITNSILKVDDKINCFICGLKPEI